MNGAIASYAKNAGLAVCAVGILTVGGMISQTVRPKLAPPAGMSRAQQSKLEEVASASLFGQFRSSMSDFLWLKVDKYLHTGVDLRATTPAEKRAAQVEQAQTALSERNAGFRAHHDETTVVPSARNDWRGTLGNVERAVLPYQDMRNHTHKDPKEALPLFRLMTWSNPHFIPGYVVGASMMARDKTKYKDAIAFLEEGARNNPQNLEIESAVGMMYTAKTHDYAAGLPHLVAALTVAEARDKQVLTEDEQEAYQNAFRWAVLNLRESKKMNAALQVARRGLDVFPNDSVCRHFLGQHGDASDRARLARWEASVQAKAAKPNDHKNHDDHDIK